MTARAVVLLLALLAACSPDRAIERDAARLEAEFLGWWEEAAPDTAGADPAPRAPPERSRQETFSLATLHRLDPGTLPRPRQARGAGWEVLDLGSIAHRRALLWVPAHGTSPRGASWCAADRSYLGVEPFQRWTELRLDPYCDPAYGPEEVHFTLHKLHEITWPLLQIEAGAQACAASGLYRYDDGAGRYLRLRDACGAEAGFG